MKNIVFILSLLICLPVFAEVKASHDDLVGVWWSPEQKSKVEITKDNDKYFGRVIAIRPESKDKKIDGQGLIGSQILKNFVFKRGMWLDGTIFDPENGKTYKCNILLKDKNTLNVRGYVGISLFGRSAIFTRVSGENPSKQQEGEPERYYGE